MRVAPAVIDPVPPPQTAAIAFTVQPTGVHQLLWRADDVRFQAVLATGPMASKRPTAACQSRDRCRGL